MRNETARVKSLFSFDWLKRFSAKISVMHADVIIVGGGLSGGLLALRLALGQPEPRILLLERSDKLGGNHTWGFSTTEAVPGWLQPLISKTWTKFDVRFPRTDKTFDLHFHVIRSQDFNKGIQERLGPNVILNCEISQISDSHVATRDGTIYRAPLVIDATGIHDELIDSKQSRYTDVPCGWMKYIGFDLKVRPNPRAKVDWHLTPTIFDARVPQMDGFRSFSTIPLDEETLYVQETFLSSNPNLNPHRLSRSLIAYVKRLGWELDPTTPILRQEEAVVPLPLHAFSDDRSSSKESDLTQTAAEDFVDRSPIQVSSAKGWYHPTTGQAVSDSIRVAEFIASQPRLRTGPVRAALRGFRRDWVNQQAFYRTFNRMVFKAAEPALRHVAFDRLFSLKDDVVGRFLTGESSKSDATKILATKPPLRTGKIYRKWASETEPESRP